MEQQFLITAGELRIPCKLTVPDNGNVRRVVLGVHGISGSANDGIQRAIAEEMELFNAATFRFDFPAHGESPLDSTCLTLSNCTGSVLAVAKEAKARYPQVEDLCVFATGFGAYVTLVALSDLLTLPGNVKLVVQTPSVRMDQTILTMRGISRETLRAIDRIRFHAPRPFDVTYAFYQELQSNIVLTDHPIPMLILHGEEDAFIRMEDIQTFRRINEGSRLVIIPGSSHRFEEEGAWDMVLDLTRDWFEYEQVLLTDWS